ncbi:MAG TPA: hypothetical protein VGQ76_10255 [Thermoanaerobaculia bacterium]|nr:hypothetical protein [Thermoanaerobaculia bacterium]
MSGIRLVVGILVMGIAVPVILFLLLDLHSVTHLLTVAAVTLFSWGVADVVSTILERPRLKDRSPGRAIREDWEGRSKE